jgi:Protein of unknown function (DUF3168)
VSCEAALRARLLAVPEVATLVGGSRIYPIVRPQGSPLPALTYFRAGELRGDGLTQPEGLTLARIQLDAWAGSYADAVELALECQRALKHYQAPPDLAAIWMEGQQQDREADTNTYRVQMDWDVWTEES